MATPDKMKNATVQAPDTLVIELASGKIYRVSLAEPMARIAGFAPLHDPAMFATAKVADWGWTLEWDCGLSMASERLYQMGKEQCGEAYPVAEFKAWMERNGMSLTTVSDALGLSRRAVSQYSSGARPIPKVIGLALRGLDRNHG
ncbi:MAG: helix-turn-helix transcriptional regulator [Comamonadaceae bacterium]